VIFENNRDEKYRGNGDVEGNSDMFLCSEATQPESAHHGRVNNGCELQMVTTAH